MFHAGRTAAFENCIVILIHGKQVVKAFKIIACCLARPEITEIKIPIKRGLLRALIRRIADMKGMGTGRIDNNDIRQSFILHQFAENPVGSW